MIYQAQLRSPFSRELRFSFENPLLIQWDELATMVNLFKSSGIQYTYWTIIKQRLRVCDGSFNVICLWFFYWIFARCWMMMECLDGLNTESCMCVGVRVYCMLYPLPINLCVVYDMMLKLFANATWILYVNEWITEYQFPLAMPRAHSIRWSWQMAVVAVDFFVVSSSSKCGKNL